ncbi:MAG: D-glycero-beta-D-manno-heptose 1,7-bisphosphate 7-phosphatase [Deferribacterales bacterium]|jgi:D-glycero-D-manno-heptose 1,7-bisphosphate phosphatase|uniref:D-glycero-beta-D-manno-heptose 1,7-bisphosphate 7-phosphatase n=1 Tax=Deferrivibrio essentukiensis TaxID=2880922 RepID=UPI00199D336F|nr:D-glycero-beta-D-manno-heptose 1,7-bisphosphate 7-phosphatase [Deferrivibrio essentukiensis]MBC7196175.1 D-glycero-beta-D-manno-heptose 1,7-bisphosphate 7-phosphatase [Deferribacterales bacterium]MCB4205210.1 D-glycero-beta-D-manno-heptose 1,7-bisphosphate 7-phosphatase [Deferrivibrio essentukiensis]
MKKPTVFIDRDGTINRDAGYINSLDNFEVYPFAPQAIKLLKDNGYLVVIITNQAGIARGIFTENFLEKIHNKMRKILQKNGTDVDGIFYCPHYKGSKMPEYAIDCDCRKPKIKMIEDAIKTLPIDRDSMYMIGDKYTDIQMGINAGCKTIMVKTGYGAGEIENDYHNWPKKPDFIADNLLLATLSILNKKI